MSIMTIDDIKAHLPHRYPFLLVDRVLSIDTDTRITALKNVTVNEPFFQGHFPQKPVMPGVMMIEAMAQVSGVLIMHSLRAAGHEPGLFFLASVDRARFKRVVTPGDQLIMSATVTSFRTKVWKFHCEAHVDGELACEADIMNIQGSEA
jgi:3-hydroxyacyl-[acyl-carrier-protein] dehydratase